MCTCSGCATSRCSENASGLQGRAGGRGATAAAVGSGPRSHAATPEQSRAEPPGGARRPCGTGDAGTVRCSRDSAGVPTDRCGMCGPWQRSAAARTDLRGQSSAVPVRSFVRLFVRSFVRQAVRNALRQAALGLAKRCHASRCPLPHAVSSCFGSWVPSIAMRFGVMRRRRGPQRQPTATSAGARAGAHQSRNGT
jgi:hypothetical protein